MADVKRSAAGPSGRSASCWCRLLREFRDDLAAPRAEAGYGDIRDPHLQIFGNIRMGGIRLTELADRAQLSLAATSELVNDLEELGYLTRRPDPADGRAKLIDLTKRGRDADGRRRWPRGRHRAALVEGSWARRTSRRCAARCSACSTSSTRRTHGARRRRPPESATNLRMSSTVSSSPSTSSSISLLTADRRQADGIGRRSSRRRSGAARPVSFGVKGPAAQRAEQCASPCGARPALRTRRDEPGEYRWSCRPPHRLIGTTPLSDSSNCRPSAAGRRSDASRAQIGATITRRGKSARQRERSPEMAGGRRQMRLRADVLPPCRRPHAG